MANRGIEDKANSGAELFLDLRPGLRLRTQIEEALRDAIRSGRLAFGTRLPSTRVLAQDLNVSRTTVLAAYAQLSTEGWIAGRRGSGTVVAARASPSHDGAPAQEPDKGWKFDLRPARADSSSFPRREWLRALREAVGEAPDRAFGYGDPRGHHALRNELAAYLGRARGLRVTADNLIVTAGYTQAVNLVASVMAERGVRRVAMEDPAVPEQREIVRRWGHEVVPIPVDDAGARVAALERSDAGAVFLTPNRQHPLGMALSARRRTRLLEWARGAGAFVVEDDYDGEFRYDDKPIGPLQGLDPQFVIYAGTVSKTLAPALRIGWLAAPEELMEALTQQKRLLDFGSPAVEQLALASMLRRGAYDRHIRKMRLAYRRRRDELVAAISSQHPAAQLTGTAAGLNLVLGLTDAEAEANALGAADNRGVAVGGLLRHGFFEGDGWPALLIGYAAVPAHDFSSALRALLPALDEAPLPS